MTYLGDLVILLLGLYAIRRLTQVPIVLNLTVSATPPLPPSLNDDEALSLEVPRNVLDYINIESEDWAREARKRKAKKLFLKEKNWDSVLLQLQQEDMIF